MGLHWFEADASKHSRSSDKGAIALSDPNLSRTLTNVFELDLAYSKALTLENWRQRSLTSRMLEEFWRPFSEIF
jgi:hypothetical protein